MILSGANTDEVLGTHRDRPRTTVTLRVLFKTEARQASAVGDLGGRVQGILCAQFLAVLMQAALVGSPSGADGTPSLLYTGRAGRRK